MAVYKTVNGFTHVNQPLSQILDGHLKWLKGMGGERADLRQAALSDARRALASDPGLASAAR